MIDAQMLQIVHTLSGDTGAYVATYVELAKGAVVNRLFPFRPDATWDDVPERYHMATCNIACYLVNKRGAEGEISHNESGVSREYEASDIPESMFRGMVPFAGLPL